MRALIVTDFGAEPRIEEVETPSPGAGEVLVRIEACALNFADLLMAKGTYQDTPEPPFALGMEVAGRIEALGEGVKAPKPGTRIAVFGGSGGMAEYGTFPADRCIPIPDGMPSEVAAGFIVAYGTSHLALTHRARLKKGETLLVLGAAGGVGLTAVEVGKKLGATVIAVANGAEKLEACKAAGADHLIDGKTEDIRDAVRALGGTDVVYDPVGGDAFKQAMRACKPEARIIVIGFASGEVPQIPANIVMVKNITVIGFYWGAYTTFNPGPLVMSIRDLMGWYADGNLDPHISHVLPLDQATEALDLLRQRKSTGKVVVTP